MCLIIFHLCKVRDARAWSYVTIPPPATPTCTASGATEVGERQLVRRSVTGAIEGLVGGVTTRGRGLRGSCPRPVWPRNSPSSNELTRWSERWITCLTGWRIIRGIRSHVYWFVSHHNRFSHWVFLYGYADYFVPYLLLMNGFFNRRFRGLIFWSFFEGFLSCFEGLFLVARPCSWWRVGRSCNKFFMPIP